MISLRNETQLISAFRTETCEQVLDTKTPLEMLNLSLGSVLIYIPASGIWFSLLSGCLLTLYPRHSQKALCPVAGTGGFAEEGEE